MPLDVRRPAHLSPIATVVGEETHIAAPPEPLEELTDRTTGLRARLGGKRIAAPPCGAQKPDAPLIDLMAAAERYRALLLLDDEIGVVPLVEVWGFSKNLSRLCQAALIAIDSGHDDACILA